MRGQRHAPAALYSGKDPVPIVQEAGWAQGVWTGAENLAPTGIRSPVFPARSHSLYKLSYPGPHSLTVAASSDICKLYTIKTCEHNMLLGAYQNCEKQL